MHMKFKRKFWLLVFAVLLVTVLNPELRALILFADAVSLEVILLFVGVQLRHYWPFVCPMLDITCRTMRRFGGWVLHCVAWVISGLTWGFTVRGSVVQSVIMFWLRAVVLVGRSRQSICLLA